MEKLELSLQAIGLGEVTAEKAAAAATEFFEGRLRAAFDEAREITRARDGWHKQAVEAGIRGDDLAGQLVSAKQEIDGLKLQLGDLKALSKKANENGLTLINELNEQDEKIKALTLKLSDHAWGTEQALKIAKDAEEKADKWIAETAKANQELGQANDQIEKRDRCIEELRNNLDRKDAEIRDLKKRPAIKVDLFPPREVLIAENLNLRAYAAAEQERADQLLSELATKDRDIELLKQAAKALTALYR